MAEHPATMDDLISRCIHCGLCLDTCPTYLETGNESHSPRGRLLLMNGLAGGRFQAEPGVLDSLDHCLGCRACETACPSGVSYGRVLAETRVDLRRRGAPSRSLGERLLLRHVLWRGGVLECLTPVYRLLRPWVWLGAVSRWIPHRATRRRLQLLPRVEEKVDPAGERSGSLDPSSSPGSPIVLVRGCVARAMFPATETAMRRLLEAAGYRVTLLGEPECCGALAHHAGEGDLARRLSFTLTEALAATAGPVVFTAAGCGAHGKELAGIADHPGAAEVAARVLDLSQVLVKSPRPLKFAESSVGPAAFLDPCHLRHGQGVTEEPRELLREAGTGLVDLGEAEVCCGSAGTYNLACVDFGWNLGARKSAVIRSSGATTLITANPGCAIQLGTHLRGSGIRVTTLPVYLAERLAAT